MQVFGKCGKSSPPRFCAARSHSNAPRSLEARFDAAGDGPVTGVPRREFAALIEAMLGALIEADLFHARNAADAARLYAKAKEARVAMGIGERGIRLSLSSGQKRPLLGGSRLFSTRPIRRSRGSAHCGEPYKNDIVLSDPVFLW
jgi:hypothetical protein